MALCLPCTTRQAAKSYVAFCRCGESGKRFLITGSQGIAKNLQDGATDLSARTGQETTNEYVMVPKVDRPDQRRTYTIARLHNCSRRYIPPLAL
jgi:hypothetical protein